MPVILSDVLQHFVAKTNVASALGAQLEQMSNYAHAPAKDGNFMHVKKSRSADPHLARDQEEKRIFETAPILRCLDQFATLKESHVFRDKPTLLRLHLAVPARSQGELAVGCLRAYYEWATTSESRALVAVYDWARSLAPKAFPAVLHTETNLTHAFGQDAQTTVHTARSKAANLYADALLSLGSWVAIFNRKSVRSVRG